MTVPKDSRVTMTIPEAAKKLGVSRNSGYEAARRGEIPTIEIGNRKLVPIVRFEQMLAAERDAKAKAPT